MMIDRQITTGFLGSGELAELIRAHDWAGTGLGPIESWSSPLRNSIALILRSPVPIVLLWGHDGVMLYNDGYSRFAGGRHPQSLGSKVRESWPEIAAFNDHVISTVLGGGTLTFKDQELTVSRDGEPEQIWLDLDYSAVVDEAGAPVGTIVFVMETTARMLAERRADADRQQFQAVAQAMPVQVWASRPDGVLDWFNDQVYAYTGASVGEIDGAKAWGASVHPDDFDRSAQAWMRALANGQVYETEFRIRRHDGAFRWHLVRALPIRDARGAIQRWIGTNTDIDDRKRAETESARDRDRLWNITQDLMLVAEFSGVITAINPTATRLLGWPEEEIVGRNFMDLVHPDDAASTVAEVAKLESGATTFAFENRYRTRDGDYRLLDWTAVPDAGRIHAVARDITEERRLARDRERIWTLSPVLKLVLMPDGTILASNPSWTHTLGWSAEETVGRPVSRFIADDEAARIPERLAGLAHGSASPQSEWIFKTRDGGLRRTEWTTVSEGDTLYAFGRDVTAASEAAMALAAAEEALRQSQKMEAVGQLTGGIAHDFNNLLQGITGSLEIVQRRVQQGRTAELERFIQGATTAAGRAAALTHRLLAFSRRQPLDPRTVRANPLISSIEDLLRRTLGEQTRLEMVLAGGLWLTLCDPNQLENAVLNLAINARDAMPDGGTLTIETCNAHLDNAYAARQRDVKPGQYVCICVTDTGVGMSADTIARAFEPFYTTKPIGQGTGLGLSMIYGFARQSEGYAKIYSELGKGTTVKLYLPRHRGHDESEEPLPEVSEAHAAEAGETVLVVEDEPVVRGLIVEVLQELGYHALEAADGPSGLAIVQSRRRIDLLVTDIGLPGLNGRQVADASRLLRPDLKILFMTGYAENAAIASGFLEPGMAMITKPFAMEAFATRIRDMLEDGTR